MNRRDAFKSLLAFSAASPLYSQTVSDDDLMGPINVHEFEAVAKKKLHKMAYDFIAGGVEDELTLQANRAAYAKYFLVPRVMVDVSTVDLSSELFGIKLQAPILIAPSGGKNLVLPDADQVVAKAALAQKTLICSATGVQKLMEAGEPLNWWTNSTGQATKAQAAGFARRVEDQGCKGIVITVDNQYQS